MNLRFALALLSLLVAHSASAAEIASLILENKSGNQTGQVPVTFGHAFGRSEVPAGMGLTAVAGGAPLPVQVSKMAFHADGSLRHAVITVMSTDMAPGASIPLSLELADGMADGVALSLSDLAGTGFDAVVDVVTSTGTYTASSADMFESGIVRTWLEGELASEWIVGGPLRRASGEAHPHLAAYFHVRLHRDGQVRTDVVIENGWTFKSSPNRFTYDVSIKIDGQERYAKAGLSHHSHARWKARFWNRTVPEIYARLDVEYLQATSAVPNYADDILITSSYLDGLRQGVEPMDRGDLRSGWSDPGESDQIAPLPRWTAAYIVTGDYRAYRNMLANSEGLGAFSIHYRDENTGLPPSIDTYPEISITVDNLIPDDNGVSPFSHDRAHQPSTSYVPYLVTGDFYHLEELIYHANYNFIFAAGPKRNFADGVFLDMDYELRGKAWALRTLGHAAYIAPDSHPLKQYFADRVRNNIVYLEQNFVDNPGYAGRALGVMPQLVDWTKMSHWMQAFFGWSVGHLVELGFAAERVRDWAAGWSSGIMGTDGGYCYQFATRNRTNWENPATPGVPHQSFAQLYLNYPLAQTSLKCGSLELATWMSANITGDESGNFVAGEMLGLAYESANWYADFQPALAVAVDSGVAGQDEWNRFTGSNPNWASERTDFQDKPQWAIEPRQIKPSKPSVSISARAAEVQAGDSTELNWSTLNAESCEAFGDWTGLKNVSGSETVGPLNADSRFDLTCAGPGGTSTGSTFVKIGGSGGNPGGGNPVDPGPGDPPPDPGSGDTGGSGGGGSQNPIGLIFLAIIGLAARRRKFTI